MGIDELALHNSCHMRTENYNYNKCSSNNRSQESFQLRHRQLDQLGQGSAFPGAKAWTRS